jgi:hypothetical protein
LRQVDASVEESAHSEFARLGQACASGEGKVDDVAQNNGRSVGGDFDNVVGRVGVGFGKVGNDNFVDAICRALLGWTAGGGCPYVFRDLAGGGARATHSRFDQVSQYCLTRLQVALQAQHRKRDGPCFRPRDADDTDSAAPWRSGDSDDGIVEVHGKIVTAGTKGATSKLRRFSR